MGFVIILGMVTLVALVLAVGLYTMLPSLVLQRSGYSRLLAEVADHQASYRAAENRRMRAQETRNSLEARRRKLGNEFQMVERKLASAGSRLPIVVHEAGDDFNRSGNLFTAMMINRQSEVPKPDGPGTMPLNPIWTSPQRVDIHAATQERARELLELKYPPSSGYRIIAVRPASD
ncbi:MAG TPA: hypothetical protein VEY95_13225 [Azospirillaceae bacterium]|nr:hypothetical protein [Azospirillaceae bacterium]